jgi:uncharacterized protein YbjT (DUF2867 family)
VEHERLQQVVVNFNNLEAEEERSKFVNFDAAFCCMGTTKAKAGSAEAFRRVDYDFVVGSARALAEQNPALHYLLVSSVGANATSWFLYPRTKGESERDVAALSFDHVSIVRPSVLIAPRRDESRFMERMSVPFMRMLGNTYKPIHVRQVARVLKHLFETQSGSPAAEKVEIRENPWLHRTLHQLGKEAADVSVDQEE